MDYIPIMIPSYHRPDNIKTAKYFLKNGYPADKIYVVIDSEADDAAEYLAFCGRHRVNIRIFDMKEARERYDYIHRPSVSRRSAGQARNMFYDIAKEEGFTFYCVQDDDTNGFEIRPFGKYARLAEMEEICEVFAAIKEWMERRRIGCFGLSQTGEMFQKYDSRLWRHKVMNCTFYDTRFIYRGERGVQDDDTSQFCAMYNEGYFAGSMAAGLVLKQTPSATAKGGLTDLYNECKLLNKAMVVPITYPSAVFAERQTKNGGRLHHHIVYKNLGPCLLKNPGGRDNIAWDTYPEDIPFTNEPRMRRREMYADAEKVDCSEK